MIRKIPFYLKIAQIFLAIFIFFYVIIAGEAILVPMVLAFLFSLLLLPLCNWLESFGLSRVLTSFIAIFTFIIAVGLVLFFIGSQITNMSQDWPQLQKQIVDGAGELQSWINGVFHVNASKQMDYIHKSIGKIVNSSTVVIGGAFLAVSSKILSVIFIFIYIFFLLLYRRLLKKFLLSLVTKKHKSKVHDILDQVRNIIKSYIVGLLIEMAIVGIVLSIAFSILGIKYAILLGLITALFNIIPYLGIFTSILLCALVTLATAGVGKVLGVLIIMIVVHVIDANVLLPKVVGAKVKINALITFMGIVVGEAIWGIPGMFLSIPTLAICKIIFDRVDELQAFGLLFGEDTAAESNELDEIV